MIRHYIPAGRPSVYGASVTRTLLQDEVPPSSGISAPCGSTTHPESVKGAADQGRLMDCGVCGVAGYGAIIGFADPGHPRPAMTAEHVTPSVNTFVPARPRRVCVHPLAVSPGSLDLTRGGDFEQERRRDEFDRSDVLLLYLGLGGLSRLRSRRAEVLTRDGRSSVVKPGPGRREPLRPFSFPRPTEQPLLTRKDDPMRPRSVTTVQLDWLRSTRTDVGTLGGAASEEPVRVRRGHCGREPARWRSYLSCLRVLPARGGALGVPYGPDGDSPSPPG